MLYLAMHTPSTNITVLHIAIFNKSKWGCVKHLNSCTLYTKEPCNGIHFTHKLKWDCLIIPPRIKGNQLHTNTQEIAQKLNVCLVFHLFRNHF